MPSLDFKGKQFVYAHHLSVPFKQLDIAPDKSMPKDGTPSLDDNLIIHGDNLHALKALLPKYAGKVKCIYIDPPYNTGNEGWCYNDNVNAPLIKEWLKDSANPVDKEDLERHDKWLCMMWPRLQLLRELLAEDGVIFVSIDDNEQNNLRPAMDEIFGENNFLAQIIWEKIHSTKNDAKYFSDNHEYVICYAKNIANAEIKLLPRTKEMDARFTNPDNDSRGPWASGDLVANEERREGNYDVQGPTGKVFNVPAGKHWVYSKENLGRVVN